MQRLTEVQITDSSFLKFENLRPKIQALKFLSKTSADKLSISVCIDTVVSGMSWYSMIWCGDLVFDPMEVDLNIMSRLVTKFHEDLIKMCLLSKVYEHMGGQLTNGHKVITMPYSYVLFAQMSWSVQDCFLLKLFFFFSFKQNSLW